MISVGWDGPAEERASPARAHEVGGGESGDGGTGEARSESAPPDDLCCPITFELMNDPVFTADGETYERSAIEEWFSQTPEGATPMSPVTNEPLQHTRLVPARMARRLIASWRSAHTDR